MPPKAKKAKTGKVKEVEAEEVESPLMRELAKLKRSEFFKDPASLPADKKEEEAKASDELVGEAEGIMVIEEEEEEEDEVDISSSQYMTVELEKAIPAEKTKIKMFTDKALQTLFEGYPLGSATVGTGKNKMPDYTEYMPEIEEIRREDRLEYRRSHVPVHTGVLLTRDKILIGLNVLSL